MDYVSLRTNIPLSRSSPSQALTKDITSLTVPKKRTVLWLVLPLGLTLTILALGLAPASRGNAANSTGCATLPAGAVARFLTRRPSSTGSAPAWRRGGAGNFTPMAEGDPARTPFATLLEALRIDDATGAVTQNAALATRDVGYTVVQVELATGRANSEVVRGFMERVCPGQMGTAELAAAACSASCATCTV
jgi:hypothetical protein